ncbi:MAG: imidazoleglycerol-phosphate dehydratase HisB [Proteobacteria bacterium]|nr:imidazoleglycerol-phosphate dehydratase HisB [Pseudomonadota bacterium]
MARKAGIKRKTSETDISISLELDGKGTVSADTTIPFFDHMLKSMAKHALFDLKVKAKGDTEIDFHHTVEDVGLALGKALAKALGNKGGITRFGIAEVPMMDACSKVVLDLSGRPYLVYNVKFKPVAAKMVKEVFDPALVEEFMRALSNSSGMDLHISLLYGKDIHHSVEAIFKALGRALREAVSKDKRIKGVMSTKGKL